MPQNIKNFTGTQAQCVAEIKKRGLKLVGQNWVSKDLTGSVYEKDGTWNCTTWSRR